jgi:hypothetical protein
MQRPLPATAEQRQAVEARARELWFERNRRLRVARDGGPFRFIARWVVWPGRYLVALGVLIASGVAALGWQPPVSLGLRSSFAAWVLVGALAGAALAIGCAALIWRNASRRLFPYFEKLTEAEQRESGWSRTV